MSCAVRVKGLKKSYGNCAVLKGLDFSVSQGEIFALLGVNGAGKTTALECIQGLRKYDAGSVELDGTVGIQLQSASLPEHIRAMEAVELFAKWNQAAPDQEMLSMLGVYELGKKQYGQLSTGQKRRLHLALALIRNPDILFLDEPTAGLDVQGRVNLHQQIRRLKESGKTILLASHDMAEVESLCDRIGILSQGRIAFTGTVQELGARLGTHYRLSVRTAEGLTQVESDCVEETLLGILKECREKGTVILDIQVNRGSLEQQFMRIAEEG